MGTPESSAVLYKFRVIFLTTACVFHVATAPFGGSHAVLLYCLIATTHRHYTQLFLQPLSGKHLKNTRMRSKKIVNVTSNLYISSCNSFLSKFSTQIRWTQLLYFEVQNAQALNSSRYLSRMYSSRSAIILPYFGLHVACYIYLLQKITETCGWIEKSVLLLRIEPVPSI